jgi:hypothetical protein
MRELAMIRDAFADEIRDGLVLFLCSDAQALCISPRGRVPLASITLTEDHCFEGRVYDPSRDVAKGSLGHVLRDLRGQVLAVLAMTAPANHDWSL